MRAVSLLAMCLLMGLLGVSSPAASLADDITPLPPVSRVEVVLADEHRGQVAVLKDEFTQSGMPNVHFQFAKRGLPPQNIGLGRDVPADKAREAIRLALKYNLGIGILLPERLFPPRFITYPALGEAIRGKVLRFVLNVLDAPRFDPALANDYCS